MKYTKISKFILQNPSKIRKFGSLSCNSSPKWTVLQLLISKVYRKSTSSMKKNQLLCPIILIISQNIMTRKELNAEKKERAEARIN